MKVCKMKEWEGTDEKKNLVLDIIFRLSCGAPLTSVDDSEKRTLEVVLGTDWTEQLTWGGRCQFL